MIIKNNLPVVNNSLLLCLMSKMFSIVEFGKRDLALTLKNQRYYTFFYGIKFAFLRQ